jgi:hypothetical protein
LNRELNDARRCRPMAVMAMSAARIQFIKSTSVAAG